MPARMKNRLKAWAGTLKQDVMTLWFACKHPRTPRLAKILAIMTAAYALSPIDLIPDFIPVLGYLDDLIIVPVMIYLTVRLIPEDVLRECRRQAAQWLEERRQKPKSYVAAIVIVLIWLVIAILGTLYVACGYFG